MSLTSCFSRLVRLIKCRNLPVDASSVSQSTLPPSGHIDNEGILETRDLEPVAATLSADLRANYVAELEQAIEFTNSRYHSERVAPITKQYGLQYEFVVQLATTCLNDNVFNAMRGMRLKKGEFWAFGTQCANVHFNAMNFLASQFPQMSFHLTLGGVTDRNENGFPYARADFEKDLLDRPKQVKGHVWITCGGEYIVDLTLGSYLANYPDVRNKYGSIIHGTLDALHTMSFPRAPKTDIEPNLIYHPVAVGMEAIMAVSPDFKTWARGGS